VLLEPEVIVAALAVKVLIVGMLAVLTVTSCVEVAVPAVLVAVSV